MSIPSNDSVQQIPDYLKLVLETKIAEAYEEKKKEFNEKLDREKAQVVAGIMLKLAKQINVQSRPDEIIITVNLEGIK